MRYYSMLKSFEFVDEIKKSAEIRDPKTYTQPVIEEVKQEPSVIDNRKETDEEVISLLREIKEKINVPENVDPSTILTEEEADKLLNILITLENNVFMETPLSRDLVAQFIWNIPRPFYEMAMRNYKRNNPPCMNPMYWFYAFCIDMNGLTPHMQDNAFADVVCTATAMSDEDFELLCNRAEEYQNMISTDIPE